MKVSAVEACEVPAGSAVDPAFLSGASMVDAYRIVLHRESMTVVDLFFAVFGHHPGWLKLVLLMRHRLGEWVGLKAASTADLLRPVRAPSYRVGQTIGPWPIFFLDEEELIAGRDNHHLDFRLSVFKQRIGQSEFAVVATICRTHNRFGRFYLWLIGPFHRWGVQALLLRAARARRL